MFVCVYERVHTYGFLFKVRCIGIVIIISSSIYYEEKGLRKSGLKRGVIFS